MYKCEKCKEIFQIPEKTRPDAGIMYYSGAITRYNTPLIDMCPNCRSTKITQVGFIQPSISLSH